MIRVIPAINEENLSEVKKNIRLAETFSKTVHIDISDGRFTRQKALPVGHLRQIRTPLLFTIHYMGLQPETILTQLPKNTREFIFHYEACTSDAQALSLVKTLKKNNIRATLALNPETPPPILLSAVPRVHLLTVHPGPSGQKLIEATLRKASSVKSKYPKILISIDGGVNNETAALVRKYPVSSVTVTSAIFDSNNQKKAYLCLKKLLN